MIRSIFLYLDRTYVLHTPGMKSLWDLGLELYRQHFERCARLEAQSLEEILKMIMAERLGEAVSRTLLQSLLKMYSSLGLYEGKFEKAFLERTAVFYRAESSQKLQVHGEDERRLYE